ncbi:hypothetical protein Anas_05439 [Armadillidium nasatum]|uniref:Uncharacterized protein n=1 Tax=Armadillidium nasatum TaxID=96803 RepID=A0A5N5SMH0_9CRUS|nr:hypothetical protein Anas_05439 [Armadillidium nasatum]
MRGLKAKEVHGRGLKQRGCALCIDRAKKEYIDGVRSKGVQMISQEEEIPTMKKLQEEAKNNE